MSDVVLRCPTCGTTQNHQGECDACSEGQVRYFCSNHSPGLWLEGPECRACGARFGETPAKPRAPSPRPTAPISPAGTRGPASAATPRSVEPARAAPGRPPDRGGTPRAPSAADLLARLLAARREGAGYKGKDARWGRLPTEGSRLRLGGCLRRFILFALLLFALLVAGSFFLVGGVLQMFTGVAASPTQQAALLVPWPAATVRSAVAELPAAA